MNREEVIHDVAANAEDDEPRLRAAEWFERQNGKENKARAEFIRVQLERARLATNDSEQSDLRFRELNLLKKYGRVWQGAHFGLKKCIFRRGFVEYVHLHLKHYLHHRRELHRLEPIRDIQLTGWHRASDSLVERVANCEELNQLRTLRVHNRGAHTEVRGHLIWLLDSPHLVNLERFHGCGVKFTADERRQFERLTILSRLTHLTLPQLDTFPDHPGQWLEDVEAVDWRRLRHLDLQLYAPGHPSLQGISRQQFWNQIESLNLFGADLGFPPSSRASLNREEVAALLPQSLKRLSLRNYCWSPTARSEDSLPLFKRLATLQLHSLSLWGVPYPPDGLAAVLSSNATCHLEELGLESCPNEQLEVIQEAASPERLRVLRVEGFDIGKSAADKFIQSKALRGLRHLHLCNFPLDSQSLAKLAKTSKQLQSLRLELADLTAAAIEEAFRSGGFHHLNWLEVDGLKKGEAITAEMACSLGSSPALVGLAFHSRPPNLNDVRRVLATETSVRWGAVESFREGDNASYRATFAPENWPPTDEGYAALQRWLNLD